MNSATGFTFLALLGVLGLCQGHGRLRCPPGRSVLWRDGLRAPKNFQDNELNCGGRWKHWDHNGGKCGACGDPYGVDVEENQPPMGKYARPAILTQCYDASMTEYMATYTEITANHKGFIQFHLCPNNNFSKPVTQECLDRNVLRIRDQNGRDHGTRFMVKGEGGQLNLHLKVKIPAGMTCDQCVLQWRYIAGNSWGCDVINRHRRRCGIGYGPQESFFNCADIAILSDCSKVKVSRPRSRSVCLNDNMASVTKKPEIPDSKPGSAASTDDASESENEQNQKEATTTAPKTKTPAPPSTEESIKDENTNTDVQEDKEDDKTKVASSSAPPSATEPSSDNTKSKSESTSNNSSPSKKDTKSDSSSDNNNSAGSKPTTTTTTVKPKAPVEKKKTPAPPRREEKTEVVCHAVGIWSNIRSMHFWCHINCRGGNCPTFMCACQVVG